MSSIENVLNVMTRITTLPLIGYTDEKHLNL